MINLLTKFGFYLMFQATMDEIKLDIIDQPTAQISESSGGVPGRAVDGNDDPDYRQQSCTHTDKATNPWWQVDLGRTEGFTRVALTNRVECCGK